MEQDQGVIPDKALMDVRRNQFRLEIVSIPNIIYHWASSESNTHTGWRSGCNRPVDVNYFVRLLAC